MVGQKLVINAQGLQGSSRRKKDGCTIIGSLDRNPITGEHYNDFVIPNIDHASSTSLTAKNAYFAMDDVRGLESTAGVDTNY
jgi:hypothetical protein